MPNELIWVLFALANFVMFLIMYKLFGKMGIFFWIVMATILANIQVVKIIPLFGLEASLGNIMYGTIFLGTDVLNEIYGKKTAKKAVFLGFLVMITALIIMQFALWFIPHSADLADPALHEI
ncbi:MAG: queuosine precursor transporter, partial [Tenericutes bacterium]|nr:queuosine precursor transporter [Mycoplasmatota bacterium]